MNYAYRFDKSDKVEKYKDQTVSDSFAQNIKDRLSSIARSDLRYNFHFLPVFKYNEYTCYQSYAPSIYIEDFYINNNRVFALPSHRGISLSLIPGRYNFKVTYVIDNYSETRVAPNVYSAYYRIYDDVRTSSPYKSERRTLELNDIYIEEEGDVFISLLVRFQAIFDRVYGSSNNLIGHKFIRYEWNESFRVVSMNELMDIMQKDSKSSIECCLYPFHYSMNRDYSLNQNVTKNNPIKISNGKYFSYHGEMLNSKKEGLGYYRENEMNRTIFTRFVDDGFAGYGSVYYDNGYHEFGFLASTGLEGPVVCFYVDGGVEFADFKMGKKQSGIIIYKNNELRHITYDDSFNYRLSGNLSICKFDHISNAYEECLIFEKKSFDEGEYTGEIKDGLPHGFGAMNYNNGTRYVGYFRNGYKCGIGTLYQANGEYLHGPFNERGLANGEFRAFRKDLTQEDYYFKDNNIIKKYWYEGVVNNSSSKVNNVNKSSSENKTLNTTNTTSSTEKEKALDLTKTYQIKYLDGSIYNGKINSSKIPNGKGKKTFKNGDVYEGDFSSGDITGQGKYVFANGEVYEGSFVNGSFKLGTFYYQTGEKYHGEFADNKRDGFGTFFYKNGDSYSGYFASNLKNGEGTYYFSNGEYLVGVWKNDIKDGIYKRYNNAKVFLRDEKYINDVYDDPNKICHSYTFENAVINENYKVITYDNCKFVGLVGRDGNLFFGTFYFNDGFVYTGFLDHFNRTSFGMNLSNKNTYYVGEFADNKRNGFGFNIKYKNEFEAGFYADDKKNAINITYDGSFRINVFNMGKLVDIIYIYQPTWEERKSLYELKFLKYLPKVPFDFYIIKEKGFIVGEFENRKLNGFGKYDCRDFIYVGTFKDGYFHGFGTYIWADGDVYIGQFKDNCFHGFGLIFYKDGIVKIRRYENGDVIEELKQVKIF